MAKNIVERRYRSSSIHNLLHVHIEFDDYTKELAYQQVEELLKVQSGLYIQAVGDGQIELVGNIYVNCESKGYVVYQEFFQENALLKVIMLMRSICEGSY